MTMNNEDQLQSEDDTTPIQKFFQNSNIFLTGGTGFLGILLLEKLLVSCPGISKIFLLVRKKRRKSVETRLDEMFDDVVFSRLKTQMPNFREKIVPIEGDCELPELGIQLQDQAMLKAEVDVVFHGAATVRFDETLKKATNINVKGVRDMLRLAQNMPKLKSLVHISTAYSNCTEPNSIEEKIYPPAMGYQHLINIVEALPMDLLSAITPTVLAKYPNTYSFTKQIAEDVVKQEGRGLPIGIHRPSIVISTYKEPLPGWINNVYGPSGLMAGGGVGIIKASQYKESITANIVPADLVTNSIICSAWDIANIFQKNDKGDDIPVYNFESGLGPKITFDEYAKICVYYGNKYHTSVKSMWYLVHIGCDSYFKYTIVTFFLHHLHGYLIDFLRICMGKKPLLTKIYKKIDKMVAVLSDFSMKEWVYQSENVKKTYEKMTEKDREIFYFDYKGFDWKDYLRKYTLGIRIYLVKDPIETLPEGRKWGRKLYWIHQITKYAFYIFSTWILWCLLSIVCKFVL